MKKYAESSVSLNPVLAERWSPRAFDVQHEISFDDLTGILEAARWSPSANNLQPWRFLIGRRGDETFNAFTKVLSGFNNAWVPKASALILVAAQTVNEDGTSIPYALYDAGIASANATTEAHHRGLMVHQIAGFDKDAIAKEFNFTLGLRPLAILVIGKQAPVDSLGDQTLRERELAPRQRVSLNQLVINSDALGF